MKNYKKHFLRFAEERKALKFGEFTLKSGRNSPYFFNAGTFNSGEALARLGRYYADAIMASGLWPNTMGGITLGRLTARKPRTMAKAAGWWVRHCRAEYW